MSDLYMLDTNIVSELARNPHGIVANRISEVGTDAICVSIITTAELYYGCAKKDSSLLSAQIKAILGSIKVLAIEPPSDVRYGKIRADLEAAGTPIGPNDLLIAAHASAIAAILVTANIREFARIPNLSVQNWLELGEQ